MRGVTVVLDVLAVRRVGQTVLVPHLLHDLGLGDLVHAQGLVERLAAALGRPGHRDERVCLPPEDALDRGAGVEPRGDGAPGGLDGGDGGLGGARDDNVDGLLQGALSAACEQLHSVLGLVDAARLGKLADGDGPGRVDTALVNPLLDAIEVDGCHFHGKSENTDQSETEEKDVIP